MPRRIAVVVAVILMCVTPRSVIAGGPGEIDKACTTTTGPDSVTVECNAPAPRPAPRPAGVVAAPQPCRWEAATAADGWDPASYGNIQISGYVFAQGADGAIRRQFPDGREETVFNRVCPNGTSGFTWVDTSITVQDVIDDAVDRARGAVPAPMLDISPPPEAGGIVNLGMWLAIQTQPPVTVRAEAGVHWAEATVTLASTRWDFGNGDQVVCDGVGVPIVDLDTLEQGPCGYTFRRSSPDDAPYQLGVTATWAVTYRSSGGSGSAGSIPRTLTVDYDVDEIQTIGISN